MEPATAACAGAAIVTLALGVIGSLPAAARRLGAIRIPIPMRPIAAILMLASITVLLVRPRPAAATVPPPIVRLSDQAMVGDDGKDGPVVEDGGKDSAVVEDGGKNAPVVESIERESEAQVRAAFRVRTASIKATDATYEVQPGDSLWRIAERTLAAGYADTPTSRDIGRFWPRIFEENRALIGDNPNVIFPGQLLHIPEA